MQLTFFSDMENKESHIEQDVLRTKVCLERYFLFRLVRQDQNYSSHQLNLDKITMRQFYLDTYICLIVLLIPSRMTLLHSLNNEFNCLNIFFKLSNISVVLPTRRRQIATTLCSIVQKNVVMAIKISVRYFSFTTNYLKEVQMNFVWSFLKLYDLPRYYLSFQECGRNFANKHYLKNHMRVHLKDRPFPCTICNKRQGKFPIGITRTFYFCQVKKV